MTTTWVNIETSLPALEVCVWLYDPSNDRIWIGCRCDDGDGWLWANAYGSAWWNGEKWECDAETDDDYKPTHWMALPLPPHLTEQL